MEKLNEYLQSLLSTCSEELHLEPDKKPYLVSANGTTDVANVPILGTQISMMVFPLIPPEVKSALPHNSEVEFVHPHNLGNFNFVVQKSPAGFNVTIRPLLTDAGSPKAVSKPLPSEVPSTPAHEDIPFLTADPEPEPATAPVAAPASYVFESASAGIEYNADIQAVAGALPDLIPDTPVAIPEYSSFDAQPEIEVVSVNDPAYQTVFSPTADYEPPGNRGDFANGEYVPPSFDPPAPVAPSPFESVPPTPPSSTPSPSPEPSKAEFVATAPNAHMSGRMDALFQTMAEIGASDLHLSVSVAPMIRKDGKMKPLESNESVLTPESMRELLTSIRRSLPNGMTRILHTRSRVSPDFAATFSWTAREWERCSA
jgi:hypothetical protein